MRAISPSPMTCEGIGVILLRVSNNADDTYRDNGSIRHFRSLRNDSAFPSASSSIEPSVAFTVVLKLALLFSPFKEALAESSGSFFVSNGSREAISLKRNRGISISVSNFRSSSTIFPLRKL